MNVLVTGANGFIGKHVSIKLERLGFTVFKYDIDSSENELINYIKNADFIVHLAGINSLPTLTFFVTPNFVQVQSRTGKIVFLYST